VLTKFVGMYLIDRTEGKNKMKTKQDVSWLLPERKHERYSVTHRNVLARVLRDARRNSRAKAACIRSEVRLGMSLIDRAEGKNNESKKT
jgi:hypothetical protein